MVKKVFLTYLGEGDEGSCWNCRVQVESGLDFVMVHLMRIQAMECYREWLRQRYRK